MSSSTFWRMWPPIAALLVALSVLLVNGQPLIYFDTAGYMVQGAKLFGSPDTTGETPEPGAAVSPSAAGGTPTDSTVVGSRSAVYSLFLAGVIAIAGLPGVVSMNLGMIWLAAWLLARRLTCGRAVGMPPGRLAAIGLLAACLGSLPFYVAFVMPDILAPILILVVAVLFADFGRMTWAERAAAIGLALFATVAHPSHLLIVLILVPVGVFASPAARGRRLPLGLMLAALLIGGGLAERFAFGMAAERFLHKRVVYLPFVTARLIDDGPGLRYLETRCPDPSYPTCALYRTLSASDDASRFDAPNILFSRTPQRGSYMRLSDAERTAVAEHQLAFLKDVLTASPLAVAGAIVRNIAIQLAYVSVEMTVPSPETLEAVSRITDQLPATLGGGRLVSPRPGWIPALTAFHALVYAGSLLILAQLALAGRLSARDRALVLMVLAGILANAIVCGAVSEPAHRYGARVMFLLPLLATMLRTAARPAGIVSFPLPERP